jgi:hypothetical protein
MCRCADPYVQLACHILIELAMQHGQDHRLLEAASILEHALTLSPSNFHFKLILLRIYSLAGSAILTLHYKNIINTVYYRYLYIKISLIFYSY